MLTGVHFLLTYMCVYECDHCFVYSSPESQGTFTIDQIKKVLDEARKLGTVEWMFFEGGEPFLFYPVMLEGMRLARDMGFRTGTVTNSYWVTSEKDAELWLKPLKDLGISNLSVSDDEFHFGEDESPAKRTIAAAKKLGIPMSQLTIDKPLVKEGTTGKGEPVVDGGAQLKGRAVDKLTEGLPKRSSEEFTECNAEELRHPKRVHVDPYGNVHICQGIIMGNMWETPLSELVKNYNAESHPICGPLLRGGPIALAEEHGVEHEDEYITVCHFCYLTRLKLLERFPEYLAPRQVYGLGDQD
jgi:MoaA/NifB/PqqE/SkfB family radical SAM enzyme